MAQSSTIPLFAWAVPAIVQGAPVDHTWVTTYDNQLTPYPTDRAVASAGEDYWYCWGSFHARGGTPPRPTGLLGQQAGDLALARCLVQSNADSNVASGARGTIFVYGVDGVCHQLANQVLYATGSGAAPMTVRLARGYMASTFIYGTYGLQHAAWAAKVQSCSVSSSKRVGGRSSGGTPRGAVAPLPMSPRMPELHDDFEAHAREVLGNEPEMLARLLTLKGEVHAYAVQTLPGFTAPRAQTLNARNQHLLDQAAILLGPQRFEEVFGFPPGEIVQLVDPSAVDR